MVMGFPIDPKTIAEIIAAKKQDEYGPPQPIPLGARKEYVRLMRAWKDYEDAHRIYKLHDARVDAAKAELLHAIHREVPATKGADISWDIKTATYQLAVEDNKVSPPEWVSEVRELVEREDAAADDADAAAQS
jgi:hypothetical protein